MRGEHDSAGQGKGTRGGARHGVPGTQEPGHGSATWSSRGCRAGGPQQWTQVRPGERTPWTNMGRSLTQARVKAPEQGASRSAHRQGFRDSLLWSPRGLAQHLAMCACHHMAAFRKGCWALAPHSAFCQASLYFFLGFPERPSRLQAPVIPVPGGPACRSSLPQALFPAPLHHPAACEGSAGCSLTMSAAG